MAMNWSNPFIHTTAAGLDQQDAFRARSHSTPRIVAAEVNASPSNTHTLQPGIARLRSSLEISGRDAPNSSRLSVSPYCKSDGILPECHP